METQRLSFIEATNGKRDAQAFARQALKLYRIAIIHHSGIGADRERRKLLVASCRCFRRYLQEVV
jgi:hypothetical protein